MRRLKDIHGFSLIELTIVIVTISILAAIAMQSMTVLVMDAKRVKTEREMEALAQAIAGDPNQMANGLRSDFGYVGDVGAFPPNLDALVTNPGGYSTWDGPYIDPGITQNLTGFKTDEWGSAYTYNGVTISSTGSGTTLSKQISSNSNDYLLNGMDGYILDGGGNAPGSTYIDSVLIRITYPNGAGSNSSKFYHPDATGLFEMDSLPAGQHPLEVIYIPANDTIITNVTVLPNNKRTASFQFTSAYFGSGSGSGGGGGGSLSSGLIAHWQLDESSGSTASDASGNGHTGTLIDMNSGTDWVTGHLNGALDFDGSNDCVESPDADDLDNTETLTITAWAYPTLLDGNPHAIISKRIYYPNDNSYGIFFYTGNHLHVDFDSNNDRFSSNTVFTPNQWYHIAVTYDGTQASNQRVSIYVNGVLDKVGSESSSSLPNYASPVRIGQLNGNTGSFFEGMLDDIRIYNRVLSLSEIQSLAN